MENSSKKIFSLMYKLSVSTYIIFFFSYSIILFFGLGSIYYYIYLILTESNYFNKLLVISGIFIFLLYKYIKIFFKKNIFFQDYFLLNISNLDSIDYCNRKIYYNTINSYLLIDNKLILNINLIEDINGYLEIKYFEGFGNKTKLKKLFASLNIPEIQNETYKLNENEFLKINNNETYPLPKSFITSIQNNNLLLRVYDDSNISSDKNKIEFYENFLYYQIRLYNRNSKNYSFNFINYKNIISYEFDKNLFIIIYNIDKKINKDLFYVSSENIKLMREILDSKNVKDVSIISE